ncbi:MAG: hypothetical protein IPM29_15670 [Planctomycetes bacterium]|nr:hypothetical protein [Planctomycetota bacterium]
MNRLRTSLLAALLAAAGATPGAAQQPSTDVGVGLFPFLVGNMDNRVREVVDKCVQTGADHLYVSVFRATGRLTGDLWITDQSARWNPAWGAVRPGGAGIDLRSLIGYARSRGIRVIGVLRCFDDAVQPTDPAHRQYLLDVIGWFVDDVQPNGEPTYDLDGFALDYVRFVGTSSGNDPRPVTDFVRDVSSRIGVLTLHAYLIANRYSFDGPTYDGRFRDYASTMAILRSDYGQDWAALSQYLDVLMPMCYTADGSIYSTYALHQAYVRTAALYANQAAAPYPSVRVCPVVKTYSSSGETTTPLTVEASITGALLGNGDGYQTFRYATTDPTWWPKVQQYAVPGSNFPTPSFTAQAAGLSVTLDPSASFDPDQPTNTLQIRIDWDGDDVYETPWLPLGTQRYVLPAAGTYWIGMRVRDADGHESATRRRVVASVSFTGSGSFHYASQGNPLSFTLDAGAGAAGYAYAVLGSTSGSSPGTTWQGVHVPLNVDAITEALVMAANTPLFANAIGVLDPQGRAVATFAAPAGVLTPLLFRPMVFAAIGADRQGNAAFATSAFPILIVP